MYIKHRKKKCSGEILDEYTSAFTYAFNTDNTHNM